MSGASSEPLANEHAAAVGVAEDAQEREVGRQALSILERCAVLAMTFGPGCAVFMYTSLFGWYQQQYHSSEVLVWMRLALFAPFPVMKMLQQRYDAYFDEMYTTQSTYLFRLVIMQVAVSVLMIIWMFLPLELSASEHIHPILIFGVLLGACCAPFIGSSIQVAVAIDPTLFVWAQLGNTLGMTVPVLASFALHFSPSSSHADLCRMLAVPLTICSLTSVWLATLHCSGVFNNAYSTITRRRSLASPQALGNPQDEEGPAASHDEVHPGAASSDDQQAFPLWVRLWLSTQSLGIFLDFFTLSLMGYFGDSDTTHDLAAVTLLGSAAGRLLSLPWSYLPAFEKGPMHISGALLFCLRVGLWLAVLLKGGKVLHLSHDSFLALWATWIVVSMNHNSLTDMTVTKFVSDAKKQTVAQLSVTMSYSALFIGILVATTLVLTTDMGKLGGSEGVALLSSHMTRAGFMAQLMSLQ